MTQKRFHVGCGAGFSGDRPDVAAPVVASLIAAGGPAALMFETLGERTLALAQLDRQRDPQAGFEPMLEALLEPVLAPCQANGIAILGNFGAANPHAAARRVGELRRRLGLPTLRLAVVEGDDLRADLDLDAADNEPVWADRVDADRGLNFSADRLLAANAYLGAEPLIDALSQGAQLVITGRVADPALALAPLAHYFGWAADDWHKLAAGTLVGHLLECGAQVSGGYFADPGYKDVPGLAEVGFPLAEVAADGSAVVTKAAGTGGRVNAQTVKEQLLYEIHDPAAYLTPDVVLDLTEVEVDDLGDDRVRVSGARGKPRPTSLKTTLSCRGGWLGEGEISYAGPNAAARARLAAEVLRERLARRQPGLRLRIDLIGAVSVFDGDSGDLAAANRYDNGASDLRLRLAAEAEQRQPAEAAAREVLALYCNGPAGGGGVRWRVTPRIKTASLLVPRTRVQPSVTVLEV